MNLIAKIQKLCDEQDISFRQLEQYVGIGNGVIGKWEISSPKVNTLTKIANYFNVSLDYLTGRTDVRSSANILNVCDLEIIVKNMLIELSRSELKCNDKPINSVTLEIIQSMMKSNLEVWKMMSLQKKQDDD